MWLFNGTTNKVAYIVNVPAEIIRHAVSHNKMFIVFFHCNSSSKSANKVIVNQSFKLFIENKPIPVLQQIFVHSF